ncbi:MAG: hypothetical protein ACP5O0_08670 [Acidimicrobiales bacterium]
MQPTKNSINRSTAIFLVCLLAVLLLLIGGVVAENSSISGQSWQRPAVGSSVNGFSGAPVGSKLYKSAG